MAYQGDEVVGHADVILVHGMYNGVDECLLVALAELCHIAKVDICNPAVWHGKDVPRMRVAMEQPKLHSHNRVFFFFLGGGTRLVGT